MVAKAFFAIAVLVAGVIGQGVYEAIPPKGAPPSGCVKSMDGQFELSIDPIFGSKIKARAINPDDPYVGQRKTLKVTLVNGILKDATGATGYIADNRQFQFDSPPQTGAIYTAGFSFCKNGTLALGSSTLWVQCLSGSFYNLYDVNPAGQCEDVSIGVHSLTRSAPAIPGAVSVNGDGQVKELPVTSSKLLQATSSIMATTSKAFLLTSNTSSLTSATAKTSMLLSSNITSSNMTVANKSTPTTTLSTSSSSSAPTTSTSAGAGYAYFPLSVALNLALVAGVLAI